MVAPSVASDKRAVNSRRRAPLVLGFLMAAVALAAKLAHRIRNLGYNVEISAAA
jgi:hypothetical protein